MKGVSRRVVNDPIDENEESEARVLESPLLPSCSGLLVSEGTVLVVSDVLCRLSQYVLCYPFIGACIRCQVSSNSSGSLLPFFDSLRIPLMLARYEGVHTLWRGFTSYVLFNECTSFLSRFGSTLINRLNSLRPHSAKTLSFATQCAVFFLLSSFYCSMVIDSVMSYTATGPRGILFFLLAGLDRLVGSTRRYGPSHNTFVHSKFPSLFHIGVGLCVHFGVRKIIMKLVESVLAIINKVRSMKSDDKRVFHSGSSTERVLTVRTDRLISSVTADVLTMPLWVATIKLAFQGYSILVDTVEFSSKTLVTTTASNATFYRSFFDCFRSVREEHGVVGYYGGLLPFLMSIAIKLGISFLINKLTTFVFHSKKVLK